MAIADRKKREFEQREKLILQAALGLFDSDEWLSVTVDQIAEKAEIGKGTVYKHFVTKEDIYARLTLDFYYGLLDELETISADREVIPILEDLLMTSLRYHFNRPEYRRVTQYCKRIDFKQRASDELRQAFDRLDNRYSTLIEGLLKRGMAEGDIPEANTRHIHYGMRACFDGSIDIIWSGYFGLDRIDVEEFMNVICNFMVAGISGLGKSRLNYEKAGNSDI